MDRLATVVWVGARVQEASRGVAESPHVDTGRTVLSFAILVFLLGSQARLADALDHGIWNRSSLVIRIKGTLLGTFRVGETSYIIALNRILALAIGDLFLRGQAGVADVLDVFI